MCLLPLVLQLDESLYTYLVEGPLQNVVQGGASCVPPRCSTIIRSSSRNLRGLEKDGAVLQDDMSRVFIYHHGDTEDAPFHSGKRMDRGAQVGSCGL